MTEWLTWNAQDRHRIAFDWFEGEGARTHAAQRARAMAAGLGIADLRQARECLGCHSMPVDPATPRSYFDLPRDQAREGVTCVTCHGASREWVIEHVAADDPAWKQASASDRWHKFGLVPTKNPVVQARLCVSCHVGDADESRGRRLTHAMYQAGHPPLPSVEMAAFASDQPRHWSIAPERPAGAAPTARSIDLLAVTGLVALRAQLAQFAADQAARTAQSDKGPELAGYDCTACHHDLAAPQALHQRQFVRKGPPGRPRLPHWPRALVRLGLMLADPDHWAEEERALVADLEAVDTALGRAPFAPVPSNPDSDLARLIARIDRHTNRLHDRWNATGALVDTELRPQVAAFVDASLTDMRSQGMDYESARQVGWALRTLIPSAFGTPSPALEAALADLDRLAGLSLRPDPSAAEQPDRPQPVTELLARRLKLAESWNPVEFEAALDRLADSLRNERNR